MKKNVLVRVGERTETRERIVPAVYGDDGELLTPETGEQYTVTVPGMESRNVEMTAEEIAEFEAEVENMSTDKAEAEFGDVMFSLINAARLYHINPDNALERTNRKFIRRFNFLEARCRDLGKNMADMTLAEMDEIWEEAKRTENPA